MICRKQRTEEMSTTVTGGITLNLGRRLPPLRELTGVLRKLISTLSYRSVCRSCFTGTTLNRLPRDTNYPIPSINTWDTSQLGKCSQQTSCRPADWPAELIEQQNTVRPTSVNYLPFSQYWLTTLRFQAQTSKHAHNASNCRTDWWNIWVNMVRFPTDLIPS